MKEAKDRQSAMDVEKPLKPPQNRVGLWVWLRERLERIASVIAIIVAIFVYVDLRAEKIELANRVHTLELKNAELMQDNSELRQVREKYFELLASLAKQGRVNIEDLSTSLPPNEVEKLQGSLTEATDKAPLTDPGRLIEIITERQKAAVKASYGVLMGQNFTEQDLQDFIKNKVASRIVSELETDNEFLDVVLAVKNMPPARRQKLLERASTTFKQTWEQRGRIDPDGQTEAGQEAERRIAEAIVDKVRELSKLSDAEIRKRQT